MFNIISRFYVIYDDDSPIYVGYTNRTVKQRFKEHLNDKDFSDYEKVQVKELKDEKLTFKFTWDYSKTCDNADKVSVREGELVGLYGTQDSTFQKALGGGQTWASEKYFVKANKDNPKFDGMSTEDIKRYLDAHKTRERWLRGFLGGVNPQKECWLKDFVKSMLPRKEQWLKDFTNNMKPQKEQWLCNFINDMVPTREIWVHNFVNNMNPQKEIWLHNFIGHMYPQRVIWLGSFVGGMRPNREIWLSNFISNMVPMRERWLRDFVNNMRFHKNH